MHSVVLYVFHFIDVVMWCIMQIADGGITSTDPRQGWDGEGLNPYSTHGFELNDGLVNMSM